MRIFKPIGAGKKSTAAWYVDVQTPDGRRRSIRGFTDKGMTEDLGRHVEALIARRVNREPPDAALAAWLEGLTPYLRDRLGAIGAFDATRAAAGKSIAEHLADWGVYLKARGCAPRYIDGAGAAVRHVADAAGLRFLSDIQADAVEAHLADLTGGGLSDRTRNSHLASIRAFCRWAVHLGRLTADPMVRVRAIREEPRRHRRALSAEEVRRLLTAAAKEPARYGMTGAERALLYRLAAESGLRRGELASLTRASFDLDGAAPTVTLEARDSKRRRRDTLPLRPHMAEALRAHLNGKAPTAPALPVPSRNRTAPMLREDAEAAGLDLAGLDFHSLRHTTGSLLCAAGVHPRVAQTIMRHSTIELTMRRYSHVLREQESDALALLPDLSAPPAEAARATGTDDAAVSSNCNSLTVTRPLRKTADFGRTYSASADLGALTRPGTPAAEKPQNVAETRDFPRKGDGSDRGAGDGNRTHMASLEGWHSAIELRPRGKEVQGSKFTVPS